MMVLHSLVLLAMGSATAGYGDAVDGYPNLAERRLQYWTNAVRVEPEAFAEVYPCQFSSFQDDEKVAHFPFTYNYDLNWVARFHSQHMIDFNYFAHDTPSEIDDEHAGRSFGERLNQHYDGGYIGENIAQGYGSPYAVMMQGWMCSSGHRSNIMTDFVEFGPGISARTYTQNFGTASRPGRHLTDGVHFLDGNIATFVASWGGFIEGEAPEAPDALTVVLAGEHFDLAKEYGSKQMGTWTVSLELNDPTVCHEYYFQGVLSNGEIVRFPEEGSYGFGGCAFDDPEAEWLEGQLDFSGGGDVDETNNGMGGTGTGAWGLDGERLPAACSAVGTAGMTTFALPLGLLMVRRRED